MNAQTGSLSLDLPSVARLPVQQRRLLERFARLRQGSLRVALGPDRVFEIRGGETGPGADILVHRPAALLRRLMWRGDLGFAEAYMAGDWDSEDPARLIELFALNIDAYAGSQARPRLAQVLVGLQHRLRRNSRRGSRRNIAEHYDLGNDFYAQWLDPSMTYSAALFTGGAESLMEAQQHKYQRMLSLLDARPGERILEIGCGWGGFADYAARHGMQVVGVTLSKEQLAYARARIARAGLADRVELRLCDYRDLDDTADHIVSIEMFEAVGQEYWQGYFEQVARRLRPGGRAALQIITIDESRFDEYAASPGGFIQTYIFPGGMLPTRAHLRRLADRTGLKIGQMQDFGRDYADTLQHWHAAFCRCTRWLEEHGYDKRFRRMWRYYLAFCEGGFRSGQINVVQCVLNKS
jgi:cyclopropane-fatty-acyl-phospholipid synthase